MKLKINLAFCAALFLALTVILTQMTQITAISHATTTTTTRDTNACKELNNVNCYQGKNDGNYCSRKDQTTAETRWYHDKGHCKKFTYKGCNGNRNRFCSRESCERRCGNNK